MYKSELARAAGVSSETMRRWLKEPKIQKQLKKLHVEPNSHLLPPKAVKLLAEHFVIDVEENPNNSQ